MYNHIMGSKNMYKIVSEVLNKLKELDQIQNHELNEIFKNYLIFERNDFYKARSIIFLCLIEDKNFGYVIIYSIDKEKIKKIINDLKVV